MSDSLADLLKRQQQSSPAKSPTPPAEAPPDEAAEMAKIAKEHAAKAAVVAGRVLRKATKLGLQHSVKASQQAQQKLSEVTPEQWAKTRQLGKQAGFILLVLAAMVVLIYGGVAGWKVLAGHQHAATATTTTKQPTPETARSEVERNSEQAPATAVEPPTAAQPVPAVIEPSEPSPSRVRKPVDRPVPVVNQPVAHQQQATPRRQAPTANQQGVNAKYRATAPKFDQQSQRNIEKMDAWFKQLNQQKENAPATSAAQGNTHGSQPAHQ